MLEGDIIGKISERASGGFSKLLRSGQKRQISAYPQREFEWTEKRSTDADHECGSAVTAIPAYDCCEPCCGCFFETLSICSSTKLIAKLNERTASSVQDSAQSATVFVRGCK